MGDEQQHLVGLARGIVFAARAIERSLSELTIAQYRILTLVSGDPARASALAERAALSKPTLTGLIEGLVARGWLSRADVDGDRRGVTLTITPAGRAVLRRADVEATEAVAVILGRVDVDQRAVVATALGLFADAVRTTPARPAAGAR